MEDQTSTETDTADDVYRHLQQHLDDYPVPFPPTETGSDIRLLKQLFTPEEAKIASMLQFSKDEYESLDSISERLESCGYSKVDLEQILEGMVKKGSIWADHEEDGSKRYGGAPLIVGMFEQQVNKFTPGLIEEFTNYLKDGWGKASMEVGMNQLRVVPIGVSFEHKTAISTFDDIKKIMDAAEGPFTVTTCVCRQFYDEQDKQCKNTQRREVCLAWGRGAKLYNEAGWGREIGKEEALEILKENEKEGMILQPSNSQQPEFVCSCCTCCDLTLRFLKRMPTPAQFVASNYFAQSDPELCTGCGTCVDRCQMDAITLENEKSVINKMRCIGCGNCASTCPSEAITLEKKDVETVPPLTQKALYAEMQATRDKIKEREMKRKARQANRKAKSGVSEAIEI